MPGVDGAGAFAGIRRGMRRRDFEEVKKAGETGNRR